MISNSNSFEYSDDFAAAIRQLGPNLNVVRIPKGLTKKRQLLATLSAELDFPDYFGHNWDAFEECLSDLSWLKNCSTVAIVHADVPCQATPETLQTYLSILQSRLRDETKGKPKLRVLFPSETKKAIESALNANAG